MAASLFRRAAARAVLAGGAAILAMFLVRECESSADHEITIVVDPAPLGDTVRGIRVDVFDRRGARGSIERRYQPGDVRAPVRMRAAAPGEGGELNVEVETDDGLRRSRQPLTAPAGSTVRVTLGEAPATP